MKNKHIPRFIKKCIIKVIVFTFIMAVIAAIGQSITPIINNHFALMQMQNDDALFIFMNMYNRLKPFLSTAYVLAIILFVYTLGRDTYKFVKTINTNANNEKEI